MIIISIWCNCFIKGIHNYLFVLKNLITGKAGEAITVLSWKWSVRFLVKSPEKQDVPIILPTFKFLTQRPKLVLIYMRSQF